MKTPRTLVLLALIGAACGEMPEMAPFGGVEQPIVNGTPGPQNTFLTAGQQLAVIFLGDPGGSPFCSGTLIAPRAVITARHCTRAPSVDSNPAKIMVGLGSVPSAPLGLIPVAEVNEHPTVDFSLLILGGDATVAVNGVVPIDMNRDPVGVNWFGRWVDAAGWGDTYDTNPPGKYFASVEVTAVNSLESSVLVDGHGEQGICYGDSGGPILYQPDADTPPVVVGTEQWGDNSCKDVDHLSRVDLVADFVDNRLNQPLPPPLTPCPGQSGTGGCEDGRAFWCKSGFLHTRLCANEGLECGYLGPATGYDCLPAGCGAVDFYGACDGSSLAWCGPSGLSVRDCAVVGLTCIVDETTGTADCKACPCTFTNAAGHCDAGACVIDACDDGFTDKDGSAANGCEAKKPKPGGCAATPRGLAALLGAVAVLVLKGRRRR
jgi:hypothetical protein